MRKNNYLILLSMFLFLVSGCQDVKKGFTGKNIDEGQEFLVIKKNPLVVPPDFEKMPLPKNKVNNINSIKIENEQGNEFEKLLKSQDENSDVSDSSNNTGELEKKIIDKIK
jgi:hypothetical protein